MNTIAVGGGLVGLSTAHKLLNCALSDPHRPGEVRSWVRT